MSIQTFNARTAEAVAALNAAPNDTFEDVLAQWQAVTTAANALVARERELRLSLFGGACPTPREGVNNVELPDGRICKFTHKINRTLQDPTGARAALLLAGCNDIEMYVKTKYELAEGPYKKLNGPLREVLDDYIVSKPGLPSLEIR